MTLGTKWAHVFAGTTSIHFIKTSLLNTKIELIFSRFFSISFFSSNKFYFVSAKIGKKLLLLCFAAVFYVFFCWVWVGEEKKHSASQLCVFLKPIHNKVFSEMSLMLRYICRGRSGMCGRVFEDFR